MIKSFKIRLYPTKSQEQLMWKHIGACRFIWNYMLEAQQSNHEQGGRYLSAFSMIKLLTPLKQDGEHDWLYDVSNASLQTICRDVDSAYQRFFTRSARHPKFKSRKRARPNFPIRAEGLYFADAKRVQIQKLGRVKCKTDFEFPLGRGVKFTNPRISYINGKWMLSFGMGCENQAPVLTDKPMGIDLGLKDLAVAEFNGTMLQFHNINKSKQTKALKKRLLHTQRSISRKYEQNRVGGRYVKTKNIEREEAKLRKIYARTSNIRNNYIHQITHALVEMHPCRVVMEDLNMRGMMSNRHLAKAVQEQCFYEFLRQMQYKCEWNGIEFIQADRFYPSSKTCSGCGTVKADLKLSDRTYRCECCGLVIDRDYNAAINLSRYTA